MKAHLVTTKTPILSQYQIADCGKVIRGVEIVFMWDEAAMCEGLTYGKNVCPKCQLAGSGERGRMMVYGITERRQDETQSEG